MSKSHFAAAVTVLLTGSATHAAIIHLSSSTGETCMGLATTGDLQIRITTQSVDTIQVAFINAFLDSTGEGVEADSVDVVGVTAGNGDPWVYDRSAFEDELPVELDEQGREYGLVSGDQTYNTGGYPLGGATYVHDILHLSNTNEPGTLGSVNVIFESGDRAPNVTGPGPSFLPFPISPPGFPHGFPNFLWVGGANGENTAFVINIIPEPLTMPLYAVIGVTLMRPRHGSGRPNRRRGYERVVGNGDQR